MGWGLPAAIGAYYSKKINSRVICLTGEGGFQMNIQELATIMHHKLPIKIFIFNNGGYLTIKRTDTRFKRIMRADKKAAYLSQIIKIAKSHSIKYFQIKS